MLSKKSIEMIEYNGYSYKEKDNLILFRKAGTDRIGLVIVMIVSAIVIGIFFAIQWWAGLGGLIVAFLIFRPLVRRIPGSLKLIIDPEKQIVALDNRSMNLKYDQINSLYIHSKFVDEYSSAFKSTSEEHQVTIGLILEDGKEVPIFKLVSDYAKPSKEMTEVHDFIKAAISSRTASTAA